MLKELLIKGNLKMGPRVYLFNLPAKKTCSPTKWCLKGRDGKPACYAMRNNFNLPSVKKSAQERYRASLRKDFVDRMVESIQRKKARYFRFHSSGDIYSEEYAEKILKIVQSCPETLFRTTTRRRDLADILQEINKLPNMVIRESLDHVVSEPTMDLPFTALDSLPIVGRAESYSCLDDCVKCDYHCWKNSCNMDINEH